MIDLYTYEAGQLPLGLKASKTLKRLAEENIPTEVTGRQRNHRFEVRGILEIAE